jgi:hypothetical protein
MMTEDHVIQPIVAAGDYYVTRVGHTLEVRARDTHAVLQVLEPPREWGEDWLWSCCGFDGLRCVPLDRVCFIRANAQVSSTEGATSAGDGGRPRPETPEAAAQGVTRQPTAENARLSLEALAALEGRHNGCGVERDTFSDQGQAPVDRKRVEILV